MGDNGANVRGNDLLSSPAPQCRRRIRAGLEILHKYTPVEFTIIKRRADAQADLSIRWTHMSFYRFCHEAAQMQTSYTLTDAELGLVDSVAEECDMIQIDR